MTPADRFRLRFGPYPIPCFKYGDIVMDEVRDCEVVIVDISNGRIPWPMGRLREQKGGRPGVVVYGALVDAICEESNQAVAHWWGVTIAVVSRWRRALGVKGTTKGTSALRRGYAGEEWFVRARKKAQAKHQDPIRNAKISAALRGRVMPRHAIEAARKARIGMKHTDEARRKMSEAQRARGAWPPAAGRPWTAKEDQLALTLPTAEAARRTGRTLNAVKCRRRDLKVLDGRRKAQADD